MCAPRKKKDAEFMEVAQEGKWFQTREKQTEKSKAVCVWRGGRGGVGAGRGVVGCEELGRGQEVTL